MTEEFKSFVEALRSFYELSLAFKSFHSLLKASISF